MTNREVFVRDPLRNSIPNLGVAKVGKPEKPEEWDVVRYELNHFVCQGEYERGLERILSTFLNGLGQPQQPAAWVSGFYGSGKSHLVKVLEYLWRDIQFPDGASARNLVHLPNSIKDLLRELATAGKRAGGLWSAAGTIGAGASGSVRLALLGVLLRSAGLPDSYPPARLVIWLKQNGIYEAVKGAVEARGRNLASELSNMYVSPSLAQALLDAHPDLADSPREVHRLLVEQYPNVPDINDADLLQTMRAVLALVSETTGELPLTLLVFDELQQYIGNDSTRALLVQSIVENCSSRFGSSLLFVATGQSALQASPQLQKLQGRFSVRVELSDTDVEKVVREVVLRKVPDKVPAIKHVLENASGEIDRHLVGTKIGASRADTADLVADYPLLPVRRRFWERVLRAVDSGGTIAQLRTQLRIVDETTREVAHQPLGFVVAGDALYGQLKADMLQSGVLLREIAQTIDGLDDGTSDGTLRSRLCATAFLIGRLPSEGVGDIGVRATPDLLADLLVQDLPDGSASLRQRIPELLAELADRGTLILVGDEYRLQTRESAQWQQDYRERYARTAGSEVTIADDRARELREAVNTALKGVAPTQGASRAPRKLELIFSAEAPEVTGNAVPVWVRDEWSVSERTVRQEAQAAGIESPIIYVFLPRRQSDALTAALAGYAAAKETLEARATPTTPEGLEAQRAMQSRRDVERRRIDALVAEILNNARVYQGGGNEVVESSFQHSVHSAVEDALVRLYPKFSLVDHHAWGRVVDRAKEGAGDPLSALGYNGDTAAHPACQEVRTFIGGGKKGSDVRKHFMGKDYGWPQDAVDGILMSLLASELVRANHNGQSLNARGLNQSQIGVVEFRPEGTVVTAPQRIAVRGLLAELGFPYTQGEEGRALPEMLRRLRELAAGAGGDPPLPEPPDPGYLEDLGQLTGNDLFAGVYEHREHIKADFQWWTQQRDKVEERSRQWNTLQRLLTQARVLSVAQEVELQARAIREQRLLLADPDPVQPLVEKLASALRSELQEVRGQLDQVRDRELETLQQSEEWGRLDENKRKSLLVCEDLNATYSFDLSSDEDLLATLEARPLAAWRDRVVAVPAKVARLREVAVRELAPKAVKVAVPPATLHSPGQVDEYLGKLRETIMNHIDSGNPVVL